MTSLIIFWFLLAPLGSASNLYPRIPSNVWNPRFRAPIQRPTLRIAASEIGHPVVIMEATIADKDKLFLMIGDEHLGTGWSKESLCSDIEKEGSHVMLAQIRDTVESDITIAAFLVYYAVVDQLEIGNLFVATKFRRHGLGKMLVTHLIQRAKNEGANRILLEVRDSNVEARSLYIGEGFQVVGRRPNYYDGEEDAILMDLNLN